MQFKGKTKDNLSPHVFEVRRPSERAADLCGLIAPTHICNTFAYKFNTVNKILNGMIFPLPSQKDPKLHPKANSRHLRMRAYLQYLDCVGRTHWLDTFQSRRSSMPFGDTGSKKIKLVH